MRRLGGSFIASLAFALVSCGPGGPHEGSIEPRHIIYLHGRIVEDQGLPAVSERYGEYRFDEIVAAFENAGFEVDAPLRDAGADPDAAARDIIELTSEILDRGVRPENITIVGASKGAYIASVVSNQMAGPQFRYVLLAGCSESTVDSLIAGGAELHGYVLAIRDESDTQFAGSCEKLAERSTNLRSYDEVVTQTGLEHGLIYAPHPDWLAPTLAFARGDSSEAR